MKTKKIPFQLIALAYETKDNEIINTHWILDERKLANNENDAKFIAARLITNEDIERFGSENIEIFCNSLINIMPITRNDITNNYRSYESPTTLKLNRFNTDLTSTLGTNNTHLSSNTVMYSSGVLSEIKC